MEFISHRFWSKTLPIIYVSEVKENPGERHRRGAPGACFVSVSRGAAMNRAEMIDLLIDCDMNPEDYALDPQDQADTFAHYLRRGEA